MTGVFEVLAHDERESRVAERRAVALAEQRVEQHLGRWLAGASSISEFDARLSMVSDELDEIVLASVRDAGADEGIAQYIAQAVRLTARPHEKVASVEAARKPRMCPFHKEVVAISLAADDPRAGFDSMAQHWGGPRHCEGDGYEGPSCKFRPEMTTQSWWDERAERAKERREERERQLAEDPEAVLAPELEVEDLESIDEPAEIEPGEEGAEVIELPVDGGGGSNGGEPEEISMSMAAGVQKFAPGKHHLPGASDKENRQYEHIKKQYMDDGVSEEEAAERAARTVNKQKKGAPQDFPGSFVPGVAPGAAQGLLNPPQPKGPFPGAFAPGVAPGAGQELLNQPDSQQIPSNFPGSFAPGVAPGQGQELLNSGGRPPGSPPGVPPATMIPGQGAAWDLLKGGKTGEALEHQDVERGEGPSPKMDKSKWSPSSEPPDTEASGSPHPTRRQDITVPVQRENDDVRHPGELEDIGQQVTERQDVEREVEYANYGEQGGTFSGGERSAVSSRIPDDVDKNPIRELMDGNYDGFLPATEVQQALAAYRG